MSVIVKEQELILPLCNYSERILDKSDHDQESPNSREVPVVVVKLENVCKDSISPDHGAMIVFLLEKLLWAGRGLTVLQDHSMCPGSLLSCLFVP